MGVIMIIELYTRNSYCEWCNKAKVALVEAGLEFNEIVVGEQISRDDFISKFWSNELAARPTVPQITIDGAWIGGYEDLKRWLEKFKGLSNVFETY